MELENLNKLNFKYVEEYKHYIARENDLVFLITNTREDRFNIVCCHKNLSFNIKGDLTAAITIAQTCFNHLSSLSNLEIEIYKNFYASLRQVKESERKKFYSALSDLNKDNVLDLSLFFK